MFTVMLDSARATVYYKRKPIEMLEFEARASRREPWPVSDRGGEARGGGVECAARGARAISKVPYVNLSSLPEFVPYVCI